jgi:hypothetical protein
MRSYLFILSQSLLSFYAYAQTNIIVEKVKLIETVDNITESEIPRVKDPSNIANPVVAKINAFILDRFEIESFDQKNVKEFRWYDVKFDSEVRENILFIRYGGEYYGAYPNYIEEELFFDLRTGGPLDNHDITFQALFSLEGYLDFMNRYWLAEAKNAFREAFECAQSEPFCSYYDIDEYSVEKNKVSISLAHDCYPRVIRACSPGITKSIPLDSIKQYLSNTGRKILVEDSYTSKKGIEKYLYNLKANPTIANNMFLFGKINGKYPFSMAINLLPAGDVSGYYYYDNKLQKLTLKGKKVGNEININEFVGGKITGNFTLGIVPQYDAKGFPLYDSNGNSTYLIGSWTNPEKTRNYQIDFTEVKVNDKN